MKMKKLFLTISCMLSVAPAGAFAASVHYACENGQKFTVDYVDADKAVMTFDDKTVDLAGAVSASGSRYVADGIQWWEHHGEGNLAKLTREEWQKGKIAKDEGITCTEQGE